MFENVTRERRRREVQPIVETLQRCISMIEEDGGRLTAQARKDADAYRKRFTDILEFCGLMNMLFDLMSKAGRTGLKPIAKTIGKLVGQFTPPPFARGIQGGAAPTCPFHTDSSTIQSLQS